MDQTESQVEPHTLQSGIEELDRFICNVSDSIGRMEEQLTPVLIVPTPQEKENKVACRSFDSPLGQKLNEVRLRVSSQLSKLAELSRRLEL